MNKPLIHSQLEILRRISEAGLQQSQQQLLNRQVDLFQQMLDEINRTKIYLEEFGE